MKTLDQHDKRIQPPVVDEIATARKDIDIFTGWLNRLENPDQVLLTESNGKGLKLYDEVDRDAHAGSVLQTRYLSVIGKEWQVEPAGRATKGGNPHQDQKIADFVKKAFLNCNFDQARQDLLKGILYGFYVAEVMWIVRNGALVPGKLLAKHPKRFTFGLNRELRLLTPNNQIDGEPVPPRKFIVFTFGSSDNPYGKGLGQALWWPVWFKKNGVKFWLAFLERFGSPTVVGKYPAGTKPEEKAALLAAIDAIQQETGITIPNSMALEFLEANRKGNVDYQAMCEYMDNQISKAVLGQTATTEGTSGALGNDEAQREVRADIMKADADLLCECLNNSLVPWIVDFNFPGVKVYPKTWIYTQRSPDLKSLADRDKILVNDIGLPVPKRYFYSTYGIPEPKNGENLVEPRSLARARLRGFQSVTGKWK